MNAINLLIKTISFYKNFNGNNILINFKSFSENCMKLFVSNSEFLKFLLFFFMHLCRFRRDLNWMGKIADCSQNEKPSPFGENVLWGQSTWSCTSDVVLFCFCFDFLIFWIFHRRRCSRYFGLSSVPVPFRRVPFFCAYNRSFVARPSPFVGIIFSDVLLILKINSVSCIKSEHPHCVRVCECVLFIRMHVAHLSIAPVCVSGRTDVAINK